MDQNHLSYRYQKFLGSSRLLQKIRPSLCVDSARQGYSLSLLDNLRHYLYGVNIDMFTDHKSLQYVFTLKKLNLCRRRWLEFLKDYDLNVLYYPGGDDIWEKWEAQSYICRPLQDLKRVGKVAYELDLPANLAAWYPLFRIFLLKKCVGDPASIVPLESVAVKDCLTYEEVPI
ncbi:hypothetical protein MTR67_001689 [Solanum verrucosum]|uniref:Reverse transcriptase RNase H-like domain-containing protein n=1 Tax=Solanum verrucosum TaxID=315347 RepID=A0AAF0T829_SOLVR|nr:hypothetical protein MTR67_001689 [Solanum verrucosum]